jgi:hypothetical protein
MLSEIEQLESTNTKNIVSGNKERAIIVNLMWVLFNV